MSRRRGRPVWTRNIRTAKPLLARLLHRQSVGALTGRAAFPSHGLRDRNRLHAEARPQTGALSLALLAVADATTSLAIACASMQHSSGRCMLVSRRCEAAALHEPPDDQWTIFQPRWQGSGRCACAPAARRRLDRGARRRDGRGHHVLDGDDRRRARVVDDRLLPPRAPRLDGSRFRLRGGVRPDAEPGGRRARSVGV
jgi:hypothetical protein